MGAGGKIAPGFSWGALGCYGWGWGVLPGVGLIFDGGKIAPVKFRGSV